MSFKTKQSALKAARAEYGPEAIEAVDFQLRNTGAGWVHETISPVNGAAHEAQGKRVRAPKLPKAAKTPAKREKAATPKPAAPEGKTKTDMIVEMLKKPGGATSKEMEEKTGWAPHSVRGLLGTFRKRGVNVVSKKIKGEPTIYRISKTSAPADVVGDVV